MNDREENSAKGFAGINLLVSKIDQELLSLEGSTEKRSPHEVKPKTGKEETSRPVPTTKEGNLSAIMWLTGIALVVFILWANYSSNEQPTTSAGYQPQSQESEYAGLLPLRPTERRYSPQSQGSEYEELLPLRPAEERPPVGENNLLSMAQLHYCLAEEIRMEGARTYLDLWTVERFNLMVDDYNNRCASFRYRAGDLERAQHAVEAFRSDILAEGRSRF